MLSQSNDGNINSWPRFPPKLTAVQNSCCQCGHFDSNGLMLMKYNEEANEEICQLTFPAAETVADIRVDRRVERHRTVFAYREFSHIFRDPVQRIFLQQSRHEKIWHAECSGRDSVCYRFSRSDVRTWRFALPLATVDDASFSKVLARKRFLAKSAQEEFENT